VSGIPEEFIPKLASWCELKKRYYSNFLRQGKHNKIRMENLINIRIELPQEVINKLEFVIIETVTKTIKAHVDNIREEPKMYTRKEAAQALRITLPTLRQYEIQGRLIPKRSGKRVLYPKYVIEHFIAAL